MKIEQSAAFFQAGHSSARSWTKEENLQVWNNGTVRALRVQANGPQGNDTVSISGKAAGEGTIPTKYYILAQLIAAELFGPSTGDGFAELARLDEDGNGWIDESDSAYTGLRRWRIEGETQSLFDLQEAGIGALCTGKISTPL